MVSRLTIEKKVPIPSTRWVPTGRRNPTHFPFRDMSIGDSFLAPIEVEYASLKISAYQFGVRNPGYKFTIRKTKEGLRCWRVVNRVKRETRR